MEWITANRIATQVIQLRVLSSGYWAKNPRKDETMDHLITTLPPDATIGSLKTPDPLPTRSVSIKSSLAYFDPLENTNKVGEFKVIYGKMRFSHKSKYPFDFGRAVETVHSGLAARFILPRRAI